MKTYKSYRMYFCNEYTGKLNKFGGLPTHLPPEWPKHQYGKDKLTFLCQLYCDAEKLAIEKLADKKGAYMLYRIRAHHGMCFSFFKEKGYSGEFTENMWAMKEKL